MVMQRFCRAQEYFDLVYGEDKNECALHVMGIVHGAARYMPDLVEYFTEQHGAMTVKTGIMGKSDIETTTMANYRSVSQLFVVLRCFGW